MYSNLLYIASEYSCKVTGSTTLGEITRTIMLFLLLSNTYCEGDCIFIHTYIGWQKSQAIAHLVHKHM